MKTKGTPRIIDFEHEYCIRKIAELLRNCRVSFCGSLLDELKELLREEPFWWLDPPEMEA